jgi:hypothetical protein
METFIIAQILGAFGSLAFLIGVQLKKKNSIIAFLLANTIIWTVAMFLVGAWSGMITNTVTLLPALYAHYVNSHKKVKKNNSYIFAMWLVLFGCWIISAMHLIDILPLIGSSIYMFSLFQKKENTVRKMLLGNQASWVIYDLVMGLYSGALFGTCIIISTLIALYRYKKGRQERPPRTHRWHHHPTHR